VFFWKFSAFRKEGVTSFLKTTNGRIAEEEL